MVAASLSNVIPMSRHGVKRTVPASSSVALLALAVLAAVPCGAGADDSLGACADCHGIALAGKQATGAPNLTVLPSWYVERQLQNYLRGLRGEAGGAGASDAHALDGDGIAAATALAASLPARTAAPTLDGDAERGSGLYRTCATCHGEQGQGNQSLNAPPLAGQNDWYLVQQLEHYQAGRRGGVPGDIWGAQMRASTAVLGDAAAVRDVVAYISTFKPDGAP
ncbi:MAG: c-type cytochrome [Gammaproteobacteria bacterium]|nr:c-type cytochrome [Gammaproteobacteria bacterium]MYK81557.1 c-type cytochrome [Gammaproteobacteria bacterium]